MPINPIVPSGPLTTISVCEMVEAFNLVLNEDGQSGTRKFIQASYLPDETPQDLPNLGDAWDNNYPNLRLVNISITYLNDNDRCPLIYTCSYASKPDSLTIWSDEEDFPTSVSCGQEFISWTAVDGSGWTWESGGTVSDTTQIYKNSTVMQINIRRTIKDLKEFTLVSIDKQGKLNNEIFYGLPIGQVMYTGFDAEEIRTPYLNSRRWNITLNFSVRRVPYSATVVKGWNYILREDTGFFDAPKNGTNFLYESTSFETLMTTADIGSDIGIILPSR